MRPGPSRRRDCLGYSIPAGLNSDLVSVGKQEGEADTPPPSVGERFLDYAEPLIGAEEGSRTRPNRRL